MLRQALAGMLWSKQLYYYDVARWLDGDPTQPTPPASRLGGRNAALADVRRLRHHVDAGQVGVPVVRRVGSRLPLRRARARRSGVREVPADPALPRVVPAPERGARRLRVVVRRRQPAGAGVGRARGVRDRRRAATSTSSAASSTSCSSTSPGGSTARTPTARTCSRAASSGSTTSGRSTARTSPPGYTARAVRRHRLDGRSTRSAWPRSRRSCTAPGRPTTDLVREVPRALRADLGRARRRRASGTRRTASSTTGCARPTARRQSVKVRSMVGILPLLARRGRSTRTSSSAPRRSTSALRDLLDERRAEIERLKETACSPETSATGRCCSASSALERVLRLFDAALRRGRVPLAVRAARRVALPRRAPVHDRRRRACARRSTTSRPSRRPACSAATRTGAGRSGCPSTTSSSSALDRYARFFGDDVTVEYPTGSGQRAHARARSPPTSATG